MKQKLLDFFSLKNLAFSALGKVVWPHTEAESFLFYKGTTFGLLSQVGEYGIVIMEVR